MAQNRREWEELGRSIQNAVDQAVNSQDYRKLNQTIRNVVDSAVDFSGEAVRRVREETASARFEGETARWQREKRRNESQPVAQAKKNTALLYGSTGGKLAGGIAKIVGGVVLTSFSFLLFLAALIVFLRGGSWAFPLITAAVMTGGGVLTGNGIKDLALLSRFKTYRRTLGQKTQCSLEKLAGSVGKTVPFVRKELQKMIRQGLFLEGHMDKEETMLITSHETYRYFEQSRLQLEQRKREEARLQQEAASRDPRVQEVLDRGNAFVSEIRRCNDAIPGEEISRKISRMELIVQRIFLRAEAHPEIVPDLKKMMDYYLPMTVKLLNAYADMDAQPVQGQNILSSKKEIEDTLDTLNLAFEKLLDSVFEDTALDISSDISVLNTLLAQEGLAEDDLSRMKKERSL
ncbi:MAG: 5-bromo-4-chloroindolyl phosphate hydrolysis family protein [Oscillospiraceae bacterium]|nr:5-bromo-4-chloroindolyl phosphate hydrolysis family protein [Oscillospiraceae bacterium]